MKNKAIFFLFLSSIFCNAESLQFLSVQEFKESITLSQNKKAFLDNYLKTINELDIEVNYPTFQIIFPIFNIFLVDMKIILLSN